jgi:methylated-DNA-[protein]-cysteine S-methyltransferase
MVTFGTAIGTCAVGWSEAGITRVCLPGMRGRGPDVRATAVPGPVRAAIDAIIALLAGERLHLRDVALDEDRIGEFDRAVYAAAREVSPGETASYGEIARAVGAGAPAAARAVGAALGRNPFPIVVPCHRVLAADGSLHGFSAPGGVVTKRRMLEIERAPGFTQQPLFA